MKDKEVLDEIKTFVAYAEREGVIESEVSEELLKFAKYYIKSIRS